LFLRFRTEIETTGTFKQRKVELVAEGFDPARCAEATYFDDRQSGGFIRVSEGLLTGLHSGEIRL
jgi:fatty-acyl-CoA synthase